MTTVPDTIERTITIDAPAESVWSLVSEPGWWINTGAITEHTITWDGDVAAVTDPTHGTFHIRRIEVREPEYIAWRWAAGGSEEGEQVLDTLCEFHIRPLAKGVEVRVVESGWAGFEDTPFVRSNHADNVEGWATEMAALERALTTA